jgi:hypothetical protein
MSDQNNNSAVCGCCVNSDSDLTLYNPSGLSALHYRLGTHGSFKKEMLDAISKDRALLKLTTRYDDDFSIATLDAWATVLDILSFYQERICNEGYLRTAIERLSVVYLAQHIHYVPAPGISAETYLAFSMNEAQGAPASAVIPKGTKVQSIPKQNQLPQIFETEEEITAKVAWNQIESKATRVKCPRANHQEIYLMGTQTGLQPGDKILAVATARGYDSTDNNWDFRTINQITTDSNLNYTLIELDDKIGSSLNSTISQVPIPITSTILKKEPDYPNLNVWSGSNSYLGNKDRSLISTSLPAAKNFEIRPSSAILSAEIAEIASTLQSVDNSTFKIFALRQKANLFGYNAPNFQTLTGGIKLEFIQKSKGLVGLYFSGMNFDAFMISSIDSTINFSISADQSISSFPIEQKNNFSVRWFGLILAPVTDNITFFLESDDGVRLWINDQILINNWSLHGQTKDNGSIDLVAGQFYSIQLEYFQSSSPPPNQAIIQLFWSLPNIGNQIVPAESLFHFDESLTDWPNFTISAISGDANSIYLDALYPKIVKDSWLIMTDEENTQLFGVSNSLESTRSGFTLSTKAMRIDLYGDLSSFDSSIRQTMVYAQSQELQIAELPIIDPLNDNQIFLQDIIANLTKGQKVFITGKRWRLELPADIDINNSGVTIASPDGNPLLLAPGISLPIIKQPEKQSDGTIKYVVEDDTGSQWSITDQYDPTSDSEWQPKNLQIVSAEKDDDIVSEFHVIDSIDFLNDGDSTQNHTRLTMHEPIDNYFDLQTVTINANVASANHGETKQEVLGNGNSSQIFQKFQLKQQPLTFTSTDTASGVQTTLEIQVNNIKWKESPSFYGASPKDKIYTTTIADDSKVTVCFGDGITGSRLPTGTGNIKAIYRSGIGSSGLMDAGQLSMLVTPQLGVNKVTNPLIASGAEDPETLDSARKNAPLEVLTLDRIVTSEDFENFTRAFAGIGKARADIIWNGEQEIVNITAALINGDPISPSDKVYDSLLTAFKDYGHTNATIGLTGYTPSPFTIDVSIAVDEDYEFDNVKQNAAASLFQAFSFDTMNFGQSITPAQIINVIQQVEGVVYVRLNQLNNVSPFEDNFRLLSAVPILNSDGTIQPAELLLIDVNNSIISQLQ